MKRRIAILVLVLAAASAVVYLLRRDGGGPAPDGTLRVSGNIEAHESVLAFRVQGRIVELPVEEGAWVEEGEVLARLDASELEGQVAHDEAALRVREAQLALALAGTRRQEVEAAQQTLEEAEADLEQRRLDYERVARLHEEAVVSAAERDLAATALKQADAARRRARERLDQAREGTRSEEIAVARRQVDQAGAAAELARVRFGYAVLRAPRAGVVLVRQAELGEVVSAGTPVVTVGDLDHVWLRAYISETDLGRVRWGQEARLTTDTFPGKIYLGRVSFIAAQAEFTPKSIQTEKERVTLVYRIKLDADNPGHELKPGMPADAVIEVPPPG